MVIETVVGFKVLAEIFFSGVAFGVITMALYYYRLCKKERQEKERKEK